MANFKIINFGCRVNAAESHQFTQYLIDNPPVKPTIFINTCAVTKKGEYESLFKIKQLSLQYPNSQIIVAGCADLKKVIHLPNVTIFSQKDQLSPLYTPEIKDKFSHTHRYLLKVQSGCTYNCSYCIVPQKRPQLYSLPIDLAIDTVNTAHKNDCTEIIITGVNLLQYQPGLFNLLEALLTQTSIPLISFGSLPLNCLDNAFMSLITNYRLRITNYFHIPIQSGSDRILKLMHRPYDVKKIKQVFSKLKSSPLVKGGIEGGFKFGTDIIVGFPTETDTDFQDTYNLCQKIGFNKIHTFRYSPRPGTKARQLFVSSPKITNSEKLRRSRLIRSLTVQTIPPSHQTPGI